jgi:hypothetical protein
MRTERVAGTLREQRGCSKRLAGALREQREFSKRAAGALREQRGCSKRVEGASTGLPSSRTLGPSGTGARAALGARRLRFDGLCATLGRARMVHEPRATNGLFPSSFRRFPSHRFVAHPPNASAFVVGASRAARNSAEILGPQTVRRPRVRDVFTTRGQCTRSLEPIEDSLILSGLRAPARKIAVEGAPSIGRASAVETAGRRAEP